MMYIYIIYTIHICIEIKEIYIYIFFWCIHTSKKYQFLHLRNVALKPLNRWDLSHWGAAWNQTRPFGAHIGDTRRSSFTFGEFGAPFFFHNKSMCVWKDWLSWLTHVMVNDIWVSIISTLSYQLLMVLRVDLSYAAGWVAQPFSVSTLWRS